MPSREGPSLRKMFLDRMKREHRLEEYQERYKVEKAKDNHHRNAQSRVMKQMGYQGPEHERMLYQCWRDEFLEEDVVYSLGEYDITESELPQELAFAFHNLHKVGDPNDSTTWDVLPSEAPTPGAWNMLVWGATDRREFMKAVIKEMTRKGPGDSEDNDTSVADIEGLLDQIEQSLQSRT